MSSAGTVDMSGVPGAGKRSLDAESGEKRARSVVAPIAGRKRSRVIDSDSDDSDDGQTAPLSIPAKVPSLQSPSSSAPPTKKIKTEPVAALPAASVTAEEPPAKKIKTEAAPITSPRQSKARAAAAVSKADASEDDGDFMDTGDGNVDDGDDDGDFADTKAASKKPAAKVKAEKKKPAKKADKAKAVKTKASAAKTKAAAAKAKKGAKATTKGKGKSATAAKKDVKPPKVKKISLEEELGLLPHQQDAWWEREALPEGQKWATLSHNGPLFPPEYVPHNIKMRYDGQVITLTPEQEEVATFFAGMLESDYAKNPTFRRNFFKCWQELLGAGHVVQDLEKCDFSPIFNHLQALREAKKAQTKEEKEGAKKERDDFVRKHGVALVNGRPQPVGNFRIEPPGLFRGRGDHPKTGMLKRRVQPEDVTINIGEGEKVPECPPGHKWRLVKHDNTVTWLACWQENINGAFKYVWLGQGAEIKQRADRDKYDKARRLKDHIEAIRADYWKGMESRDSLTERQRSTALYLIDKLALRVGNEKDEDQADTVGCCSLRVQHLSLSDAEESTITFDFLGKDSMRYFNTVKVPKRVYKNIRSFMRDKNPEEELFDRLTTTMLNSHLKSLMDGLTAKVFRTYNASITLQQELAKPPPVPLSDQSGLLLFYNRANREVAILCNHQRSEPKAHGQQMSNMGEKLQTMKDELNALKKHLTELKSTEARQKAAIAKARGGKTKFKLPVSLDSCKKKVVKLRERIKAHETKMTDKEENKVIALGTSKINYMDPRITAAWCKRTNFPIEKIFNRSLRIKFPWAMDMPGDWVF